MSLDDRQHVEAVAIIRRLHEAPHDDQGHLAAEIWLRENKPPPDVYLAALRAGVKT